MAHQSSQDKQEKAAVVEKYKTSTADTGSSEVQVALMTRRINELTDHLRTHKKDYSSQLGLLKLVGRRKRVLEYLKGASPQRYLKLIGALELRK